MPSSNILTILLLLLFTLCSAQTPPAPEPVAADTPSSPINCLLSMLNASECFSYVKLGSTETKPEAACCPELAGMVQSSPECVCNLVGGGASPHYGVKLDKQRSEELPSLCGVKTPPPSLCSVLDYPAVPPSASEHSADSEGKDKKNGGVVIKDHGVMFNSLILALFVSFTLF